MAYEVEGEKKVLMRVREDVWGRVKAAAARRRESVWGYVGEVLLAVVEVEEGKRRVGVKPVGGVEESVREALAALFGESVGAHGQVVPDEGVENSSLEKTANCGAPLASDREARLFAIAEDAEEGEGDLAFRGEVDVVVEASDAVRACREGDDGGGALLAVGDEVVGVRLGGVAVPEGAAAEEAAIRMGIRPCLHGPAE